MKIIIDIPDGNIKAMTVEESGINKLEIRDLECHIYQIQKKEIIGDKMFVDILKVQ